MTRKRYFDHDGKRKTLSEWAETTGIPYSALNWRVRHANWDIDKALTTPTRKYISNGDNEQSSAYFGSSFSDDALQQKKSNVMVSKIADRDTYVVTDIAPQAVSDDGISARDRYSIDDIIAILNILK